MEFKTKMKPEDFQQIKMKNTIRVSDNLLIFISSIKDFNPIDETAVVDIALIFQPKRL